MADRPKPAPPLDLAGVRTYPLADRKSQVTLADFARPPRAGDSVRAFLDGLPKILAADVRRAVAGEILRARERGKPIVWGLGAHVLKVGLSPVLIDLMEQGLATAIALNGAGIVHDFELAAAGHTSEDVAAGLGAGEFAVDGGAAGKHNPRLRGAAWPSSARVAETVTRRPPSPAAAS
jgi:hypothetical protein